MRDAAVPGYRLSKAKFSTRVLITLGMLGLLLGLLSATGLTVSRTGLAPSQVRAYYLGEEVAPSSESEIDTILAPSTPRPFQELLEITHLHLMGGSLMLFLLCHLLSVSDVKEWVRVTLYIVSFASFLGTFSLPWLIIYASPLFAYFFGPSVLILLLALLLLCLIPVRDMWSR